MKREILKHGATCLLAAIAIIGTMAGCGSSNSSAPAVASLPGNQTAYEAGSSNCSDEFMRDFISAENMIKEIRRDSKDDDRDQARRRIGEFGDEYLNVVCQGIVDNKPSENIDVNAKVAKWENALSRSRGAEPVVHRDP